MQDKKHKMTNSVKTNLAIVCEVYANRTYPVEKRAQTRARKGIGLMCFAVCPEPAFPTTFRYMWQRRRAHWGPRGVQHK